MSLANSVSKPKGTTTWRVIGFLADGTPVGVMLTPSGYRGLIWENGVAVPLEADGKKGSVLSVGSNWIAGVIPQPGSRFLRAVVWWREHQRLRAEVLGEPKKHSRALGVRSGVPWLESMQSLNESQFLSAEANAKTLRLPSGASITQFSDEGICGYEGGYSPKAFHVDQHNQVYYLTAPLTKARAYSCKTDCCVGEVAIQPRQSNSGKIPAPFTVAALWEKNSLHLLDERPSEARAIREDLIAGTVVKGKNGELWAVVWRNGQIIAEWPGRAYAISYDGRIAGARSLNSSEEGFITQALL